MDVDFLLDFRAASKAPQSVTDSTIFSLARILSSTSHLSSLRIRVARSSGPDSAWIRSSRSIYTATDGIPIGKALVRASKYFPISLPSLKSLEIDMLSDIAPILQAAPNLGYLRLYASGGYSQAVNKRLVESLKYVPQLEALVYSPESLKMTSDLEEAEAELAQEGHEGAQPLVQTNVDRSAELVGALGKVLPNIKSLDLRRRTHGEETEFTPCDNPISSQALLKAMENLRGLRHLYLPTSLFSEADFEAFQLAFKSDAAEEDFNMSAQAINHVMVVERAAVQSMGAIAETLRSVAFVRPLDSRDADEMSYEYRLRVVGAQRSVSRTSGMTTLVPARVDFVGPPVVRPAWAEVADPGFNTAGDYSRRPGAHVQMAPVGFSWRQRGLEFVEEHPGAGIAAAVASGIILSEASRAFYSR
ncbi:hypothetical protein DL93DRAFT_2082408 [Clavulina sp. PMI_390]|nr:hypothetical protein DL93DRAFT_2082408 [Clavulina sp. PMI_390]